MNSRNISADSRIVINIGGQEFNLTKEEAKELFHSLKEALKIQDSINWDKLRPPHKDMERNNDRFHPYIPPQQHIPPQPPPQIWCGKIKISSPKIDLNTPN